MGMHIAILPDADRGMPRWGVAPIHGQGTRIGIGVPLAVVQPQARKRHGAAAACPIAGAISCPATPKVPWALVDRHRAHRFGSGPTPSERLNRAQGRPRVVGQFES